MNENDKLKEIGERFRAAMENPSPHVAFSGDEIDDAAIRARHAHMVAVGGLRPVNRRGEEG